MHDTSLARCVQGLRASRVIICIILISLVIPMIALQTANAQTFFNKPFTLSGYSAVGSCGREFIYVSKSLGSTIRGSVNVTQGAVNFFILTTYEYNTFWNGGHVNCAQPRPNTSELTAGPITTSYSFSYLVPDNTNHYFVIFNPYAYDATGTIILAWKS
jgi:hypothetical protein